MRESLRIAEWLPSSGGFFAAALLLSACSADLNSGMASTSNVSDGQKIGATATMQDGATRVPASKADDKAADAKSADGKSVVAQGDAQLAQSASPRGVNKTTTGALSASAPATSTGYTIGALDVLDISVFKVPELSKTVQVAESGVVNLPLIGDIVAGGRMAIDVEREIAAKLGDNYVRSPQVTVFVKEFNSQRVTVEGGVKKPGVFPLRGRTTLMQALALSEGVDDLIASGQIAVFKNATAGKQEPLRYDLEQIRSGAVPDPDIRSGDLIVVDISSSKQALNNFIRLMPVAQVFKPPGL